jgi:hypothetical protein
MPYDDCKIWGVPIYLLYSTMWGFSFTSDHQLHRFTPLKTPFGLVIPLLQSQSHVTTFTHNYFLRCYTCTQLTITYTFVTTTTCSTQLSISISNYHTLSHTQSSIPTASRLRYLLREFTHS